MRLGRILLIVFGALGLLVGGACLLGGGAITLAYGTQRDDAGFFTTSTYRFETDTYALVSEQLDLGGDAEPEDWFWDRDLLTVRIQVEGNDAETPVFVGIAPRADVEAYLDGVAHDVITDVGRSPSDYDLERRPGSRAPVQPGEPGFWAASATGLGPQELQWDVRPGQWTIVAMNADGSPGVDLDADAGVKIDLLLPLGIGLMAFGALSLVGGALLVYLGARTRAGAVAPAREVAGVVAPGPRWGPVRLSGQLDPELSRWLWLVKWFLAIPHVLVLVFLWLAGAVLWVVALFAIAVTGRYPRGIFDYLLGVMRWTWRVVFYAFGALGTDRYPPFTLGPADDYPARLDVEHPERLSRGLVWVKWWLLAIPHYLVVAIFVGGGWWDENGPTGWPGGLVGLLVVIAAVALLFSRRYPRGIFDLVMGLQRWTVRVAAYALLMTDEYPPFRLDPGPDEPGSWPPPDGPPVVPGAPV